MGSLSDIEWTEHMKAQEKLVNQVKVDFTQNALDLLKERYLEPGETIEDLWDRVSNGNPEYKEMMRKLEFLPNSPTLMNRGTGKGTLSACFRFNVADTMLDGPDSIMAVAFKAASVAKWGGGVGYYLGNIRPKLAPIQSTHRVACGPINILKFYNEIGCTLITQGGRRELAQMAILPVAHENIREFIHVKDSDPQKLKSFNISVSVPDAFMSKVLDGCQDESKAEVELFDEIIDSAWRTGDPGLFFPDRVEDDNPTPEYGKLDGTNPSLRRGTRVYTTDGIKKIEDLEGHEFTVLDLNGIKTKARCFLSGQGKRLYQVKIGAGRSFYATAEHQWPVVDKKRRVHKVKTKDLRKGDYLPIVRKDNLEFGSKFTKEDGFFVGWVLADGGWNVRGDSGERQVNLVLSEDKREKGPGRRLVRYLESMGCNAHFSRRERDGSVWYELNTINSKLNALLEQVGFQRKELGIPTSIWDVASEDFRIGFLDAMFSADGCVGLENGKVRITLTSSRKELASDIADLLGFYGVKCSVRESVTDSIEFPNGKVYGKIYVRYDLRVNGKENVEHFRSFLSLTHLDKNSRLWTEMGRIRKTSLSSECVRVMEVSLTDLSEDVWDINVDSENHCFVLSGCVTGNCGEVPLLNDEACNLGSINLGKFVDLVSRTINWGALKQCVRNAVRFLDDILDDNWFPCQEITDAVKRTRKIGLGVMGWADMLAMMGIHYDTVKALKLAGTVIGSIREWADQESALLAIEKGPYREGATHRNATRLCIAPTGSISFLANASSGIEPHYALEWTRKIHAGHENEYVVKEKVSCMDSLPSGFIPKTAMEIPWEWHVRHQAAFQHHVDLAVSKTINLPNSATREDIKAAYFMLWKTGCKGGTVFRDRCRAGGEQVLETPQVLEVPLVTCQNIKPPIEMSYSVSGKRRRPPDEVNTKRKKIKVGKFKGYLHVGLYEDGTPCEVFLSYKGGSPMHGLIDSWAIAFSFALQYGADLQTMCEKFMGLTFEPNGMTGDKDVPVCTSVIDYVVRWIWVRYGNKIAEQVGMSGYFCPDCRSASVVFDGGCLKCPCGWSKCG